MRGQDVKWRKYKRKKMVFRERKKKGSKIEKEQKEY